MGIEIFEKSLKEGSMFYAKKSWGVIGIQGLSIEGKKRQALLFINNV